MNVLMYVCLCFCMYLCVRVYVSNNIICVCCFVHQLVDLICTSVFLMSMDNNFIGDELSFLCTQLYK